MMLPVVVAIAGLVLAVLGLLLVRRLRQVRGPIALSPDGYQEVRVVINGRYRPDTVRVQQGMPVRIRFAREEDDICSERVVFSAFGVDRRLPPFQETAVEFLPKATGTFLFTCDWGMYRGKLVVTPARDKPSASQPSVQSGSKRP